MTNINKNNLLPVYALVGTDKLKIQYVLKRLEDKLKKLGDLSFNSNIFDGETNNAAEIIQACIQVPFASEKRYVLVKNAEKLRKTNAEELLNYLENPASTTILVLIYSKLAKNTKVYKACQKISHTSIIDCAPPKKYKIAEGLISVARSYGGSINLNAAEKLVELIGEDTMHLDAEIQKLLLNNNSKTITIEQVCEQVLKSSDIKPWEFSAAFVDRDIVKCLDMLKGIPETNYLFMLSQICKITKELICVKDLGPGATQNSISYELGYEAWKTKNHQRWSRNFSKEQLIKILNNALECEKKMKSTSNSALAFETFIVENLRF